MCSKIVKQRHMTTCIILGINTNSRPTALALDTGEYAHPDSIL